jgi:N-acetylglutamate synthase-like GNAT family acetyltransferase
MLIERTIGKLFYSTDKSKLDLHFVHQFLSQHSYWAKGISIELVRKSIEHSMSIGIYSAEKQIGFARVVTDYTTFAYLADVFVTPSFRGKGASKQLMTFIMDIDEMKILRRFLLATSDAHSLYAQYGFQPLKSPDRFMEIHQPDIYKHLTADSKTS